MKKANEVTTEVEVSRVIDRMWKPILTGLIVVGFAYGAFIAYSFIQKNNEKKAQEELFTIQKALEDKTQALGVESAAQTPAPKKNEKVPPVPKEIEKTPESLVKNFETEIKKFESFIEQNKEHKAAYMAAVQLAGLAVSHRDLERAEKVLSSVVNDAKSGLFSGLVKSQLGTVLMDQKKYNDAIVHFNKLIEDKDQTYFHPQALLRLGTCYLETGDFEKAESMFKRVTADFPTTQAAGEAKNLIKLVNLKKGEKV